MFSALLSNLGVVLTTQSYLIHSIPPPPSVTFTNTSLSGHPKPTYNWTLGSSLHSLGYGELDNLHFDVDLDMKWRGVCLLGKINTNNKLPFVASFPENEIKTSFHLIMRKSICID